MRRNICPSVIYCHEKFKRLPHRITCCLLISQLIMFILWSKLGQEVAWKMYLQFSYNNRTIRINIMDSFSCNYLTIPQLKKFMLCTKTMATLHNNWIWRSYSCNWNTFLSCFEKYSTKRKTKFKLSIW
jgi:hypothetical protein